MDSIMGGKAVVTHVHLLDSAASTSPATVEAESDENRTTEAVSQHITLFLLSAANPPLQPAFNLQPLVLQLAVDLQPLVLQSVVDLLPLVLQSAAIPQPQALQSTAVPQTAADIINHKNATARVYVTMSIRVKYRFKPGSRCACERGA